MLEFYQSKGLYGFSLGIYIACCCEKRKAKHDRSMGGQNGERERESALCVHQKMDVTSEEGGRKKSLWR